MWNRASIIYNVGVKFVEKKNYSYNKNIKFLTGYREQFYNK